MAQPFLIITTLGKLEIRYGEKILAGALPGSEPAENLPPGPVPVPDRDRALDPDWDRFPTKPRLYWSI